MHEYLAGSTGVKSLTVYNVIHRLPPKQTEPKIRLINCKENFTEANFDLQI